TVGVERELLGAVSQRHKQELSDANISLLLTVRQNYLQREERLNLAHTLGPGLATLITEDLRQLESPEIRRSLALGDGRDIIDGLVDHLENWFPEDMPLHLQGRAMLRSLVAVAYEAARLNLADDLIENLGLTDGGFP